MYLVEGDVKVVLSTPQQGLHLLHVCVGLFPWADLYPSWVILQAENKLSMLTKVSRRDSGFGDTPRGLPLKLLLFFKI